MSSSSNDPINRLGPLPGGAPESVPPPAGPEDKYEQILGLAGSIGDAGAQ